MEKYNYTLGIDGFWQLYYDGEFMFMVHDDDIDTNDDDERLCQLIQMYEVNGEVD